MQTAVTGTIAVLALATTRMQAKSVCQMHCQPSYALKLWFLTIFCDDPTIKATHFHKSLFQNRDQNRWLASTLSAKADTSIIVLVQ